MAEALKELKNDIQNEGAIPVFKIVLASDAMISHIQDQMSDDTRQIQFFNEVKLTDQEIKDKYNELQLKKSRLTMIKDGSKKLVEEMRKTQY